MISKFFIERPVLSNVIALLMILIGGVALFSLAVAQYPDVVPPTVQVTTRYPGASANDRDGHGGAADRAAGQRRRGHDLHAVLQRRRRHLHADRHLQDRHRPRFRAGAGAEPRLERAVAAARKSVQTQGVTVQKKSTAILLFVTLTSPNVDLRQPVSEQLRHHQPPRRAVAAARRRQRHGVRRRPVFDADLARSEQAAGARADAAGRDPGDPAAEPAGHRRPGRHAADAAGPGLPIYAERQRPARRRRRVRGRHRQDRQQRRRHPRPRRRHGSSWARRPTARSSRSTSSRRPASASSSRPAPTR